MNSGSTTILGYGALLSEASSRLTFPALSNFRLVHVKDLRRVFAHPHLFLISQNVIEPSDPSLRLASLSAEVLSASDPAREGFIVAAFEVNLDDGQREAFVARERAYDIRSVPYFDNNDDGDATEETTPTGHGVICVASTDDRIPFDEETAVRERLQSLGMSVWHWDRASGLLPADVYLRHCLLSVKKAGTEAERSFREETYLADRKTTLAQYLARDDNEIVVMGAEPPAHLMARFNG